MKTLSFEQMEQVNGGKAPKWGRFLCSTMLSGAVTPWVLGAFALGAPLVGAGLIIVGTVAAEYVCSR